jgi:2-C-methyl-D-erythritol 2,4-cyclodiphosphate synthase
MKKPSPSRRRPIAIQGLTPARKQNENRTEQNLPTAPFLVGHGYDIHRLQPGGKLTLCGVVVSDEFSAIAHSDGDVVFHAIVDAVLGALGLGDIGEMFPNTDARWKNADSKLFVEAALLRASELKFAISNMDVTLLLERPKIKPFKPKMLEALRKLLGDGPIINIKAGTNEGCDSIGQGKAVASYAIVLLVAQR